MEDLEMESEDTRIADLSERLQWAVSQIQYLIDFANNTIKLSQIHQGEIQRLQMVVVKLAGEVNRKVDLFIEDQT